VSILPQQKSYIDNGKYFEADAQVTITLKKTLNNDYISRIGNSDSAFAM